MAKIAIDANIPLSFINENVDLWDFFINYAETTGHEILMPTEVFDEVRDWKKKRILEQTKSIKKISISNETFDEIKDECINVYPSEIQDPDYILIAMAVQEKVDFLVSNDYKLINVAKEYKKSKNIRKTDMVLMTVAGLFWLMHKERKDIFGWKSHIRMNLKFYRQAEIPNTFDGIKTRNWTEKLAKERFHPYHENIVTTIDLVGR
ncbi:MAG: hypothetical protein MUP22_11760 [Desulfobacterales bacterium]|nr:hypothetical protein [Desulfobacterales bacterium]